MKTIARITGSVAMLSALGLLACLVLVGTNLSGVRGSSVAPPPKPVPAFNLVERVDISSGVVKRSRIRIRVPKHYSEADIRAIAEAVVSREVAKGPLNAVIIFVYGPNTDTQGEYDVARVFWAPNGRLEDAQKVKAGDYRLFQYAVDYRSSPVRPKSTLANSGKTGLFGIPLPAGAQLVSRRKPSGRTEAREVYKLGKSVEEIIAFFEREMVRAGWSKSGAFGHRGYQAFTKGPVMVAVIVDETKGTFSIGGS